MATSTMKEAFCLFDRDADGMIHVRDFPLVIRSLGVNPSEQELEQMLGDKEMLTFNDFVNIAGSKCANVDQEAELNKAFKMFDRESDGTVSTSELKHVLLNLGEKLTEVEVEELLVLADPSKKGKFKYTEFITRLCQKA